MYYRHGNYRHANNEVELQVQPTRIIFPGTGSEMGIKNLPPLGFERRHVLKGRIHAATSAELTAACAALRYFYENTHYCDSGLYHDDGSPTANVFYAGDGEVRVATAPAFPSGNDGQYTTYRDYQIEITQESKAPNSGEPGGNPELFDFKEQIVISGGGNLFKILTPRRGTPQRQETTEWQPYRTIQAGKRSSMMWWPPYKNPIWPEHCHKEESTITFEPPVRKAGQWIYTTSWVFVFESIIQLIEYPTPPA
jgi:hypothetical protein